MKQNNTTEDTKVFGITIKKGGSGKTSKQGKKVNTINPEEFVFTPKIPKVNVIPAELTEKYEVKGVLRKTTFAVVGIAAVFGLVYAGGLVATVAANNELTAIQAERNDLVAQVTALSPYQDYQTAVDNKRTTLSEEVSTDVDFGGLYEAVYGAAAVNGVELTSVTITQNNGTEESSCQNPDPFNEATNLIGCIVLEGKTGDPNSADNFLRTLTALPEGGYVNPFITSVNTTDGVSTFNGSIAFTNALYSNRYAELALPLADLIAIQNTPDTGEDVSGGEIEQITFSSLATSKAAELIPSLTEENLIAIDGFAVSACTPEGDIETSLESIRSIMVERLPADDTTVDDLIDEIRTTLTTECEGE